jgi:hypothetical protein
MEELVLWGPLLASDDVGRVLNAVLERYGLSDAQIERQSAKELEVSKRRILQMQDDFNKYFMTTVVIPRAESRMASPRDRPPMAWYTIRGILDHALNTITARESELNAQASITQLESLVETIQDWPTQKALKNGLEELSADLAKDREQARKNELLRLQAELDERQIRMKAEMFERRSASLLQWFTRESLASIVGSCLLVLFSISLLAAMFFGQKPLDIIVNAFLLILGYFFGQAASDHAKTRGTSEIPPHE